MKIIVAGASDGIGRDVDLALSWRHETVRVGRRSGDVRCDDTDADSVRRMFHQIGQFDALVSVVGGDSAFGAFQELEPEQDRHGFERKLLAQVELLKQGQCSIRDNGSFVFTSGLPSHHPGPADIATGPGNSAVDALVESAAALLPRGLRLNVVSPAPGVEPGHGGAGLVTAAEAAQAYVMAVEGKMTGQVLRVCGGLHVALESASQVPVLAHARQDQAGLYEDPVSAALSSRPRSI
ncbi:MAG: short chain dehydrogenase [Planctomycetota bacterium]|nr:MAG: short chain dehydrogenase [Planctomycetota bacterium]